MRRPKKGVVREPEVIEKLLRGVNHDTEGLEVLSEIMAQNPKRLGIELPRDYLEREASGQRVYLFSDFAQRLVEDGIPVIPLEDPALFNRHQAIDVARHIREGGDTEEHLKAVLEHKKAKITVYASPDKVAEYALKSRIYGDALEILAGAPTLKDVYHTWLESNAAREEFMVQRVFSENCDCVVVGDGHARNMATRLTGFFYRPSPDKWSDWKVK